MSLTPGTNNVFLPRIHPCQRSQRASEKHSSLFFRSVSDEEEKKVLDLTFGS